MLAAFVAAALLGLTGKSGPWARAKTTVNGLSLIAPTVMRSSVIDRIAVEFTPTGPKTNLWMPDAMLEDVRIESIVPEPVAATREADGVSYVFLTNPDGRRRVLFDVRPEKPAILMLRFGIGRRTVSARALVLP